MTATSKCSQTGRSSGSVVDPVALTNPEDYEVLVAASLVALAVVWLAPARESDPTPVMRLRLTVPEETRIGVPSLPMLSLSPDGRRLVFVGAGEEDNLLYLRALDQPTAVALPGTEKAQNPIFSPDGQWIAFKRDWIVFDSMRDSASRNLYRKRANGTGEAERLTTGLRHQYPSSWSSDGKVLAFTETEGATEADILLLHLGDPPRTEVFLKTPFNERDPARSPDGRWIAYTSDESGRPEVYVLPLEGGGGRTKISTEEGYEPRWSPDGRELLYVNDDEKLISVRLSVEGGLLRPANPREVIDYPETYGLPFAISTDGMRFLVDRDVIDISAGLPEPTVVVNWFDELEARVPAAGK